MRSIAKPLFWATFAATLCGGPSCHRTRATPSGGSTEAGSSPEAGRVIKSASRSTMEAFRSGEELEGFLRELAAARQRDARKQRARQESASPAPASTAASAEAEGGESITNTQHAGVDEGGIVKVHGDHLVVLRRGRLFTVNVGDNSLTPVSAVDAFGPGIDPGGAWYDEMVISGDTIAVVGYSYQRGGTEIGLFDIDRAGALTYRATYHLRSNDYYSARNYASRVVDGKLVFYTPLYLSHDEKKPLRSLPALRRWHIGAADDEFVPIVAPTRVYRPIDATPDLALHTITVCDLAKRELACEASAVLGPRGRVFYVSPGSVYVWATPWSTVEGRDPKAPRSLLYRLPLDGSAPSALRVRGGPVDQFSFLEGGDGNLNVVVRGNAGGDAMWEAEASAGATALFRVPIASFTGDAAEAPASAYARLPSPPGYTFQNRFVGDHLLYGTGGGWGPAAQKPDGRLYAYRYAGGEAPVELPLPHGVDRIEALGRDAVVVGAAGNALHFSAVSLAGRPELGGSYVRKGAVQGEARSHGFFYKPDGDQSGLLGLPVRVAVTSGALHHPQESASILFLRNDALRFGELGALAARPAAGASADGCRASCVDWYGNARPIFLRGRVFALLGYELVEGRFEGGRLGELRRTDFSPRAPQFAP
jgi:beta propeller domain-containing protein